MGNIYDNTGIGIIRTVPPTPNPILAKQAQGEALTPEEKAAAGEGVQDMAAARLADIHGGKASDYLGLTAADLAGRFGGLPMDYKDFVPMGTILDNKPPVKVDAAQSDSSNAPTQNVEPPQSAPSEPPAPRKNLWDSGSNKIVKLYNTPEQAKQAKQEKALNDALDTIKPFQSDDGTYNVQDILKNGIPEDKLSLVFSKEAIDNAKSVNQAEDDLKPFKTDNGYNLADAVKAGVPDDTLKKLFDGEAVSAAKDVVKAESDLEPYKTKDGYNLADAVKAGVSDDTLKKLFNADSVSSAKDVVKAEADLEPYKTKDGYNLTDAVKAGVAEGSLSRMFKDTDIQAAKDRLKIEKELDPFKKDNGYDLVAAVRSGISDDVLKEYGFDSGDIKNARDYKEPVITNESSSDEPVTTVPDNAEPAAPASPKGRSSGMQWDVDQSVSDAIKQGKAPPPTTTAGSQTPSGSGSATESNSSAPVSVSEPTKPLSNVPKEATWDTLDPDVRDALSIKNAAASDGLTIDIAQSLSKNTAATLKGWGYTDAQVRAIKSFTPESVSGIDGNKDDLDQRYYNATLQALRIIKPDATMDDITNKDHSAGYDLSYYIYGQGPDDTKAAYHNLSKEDREKFEKLWKQANYFGNASHQLDILLVDARAGKLTQKDKDNAEALAKAVPELVKYVTTEGGHSDTFSFDIKAAIADDVKLGIFKTAGIDITQRQIDDIKQQIAEDRRREVEYREYESALSQIKAYENNGQYDLQGMLRAGIPVNTLSKVFDIEDIQKAANANKAEIALSQYRQKDGSYNLVAAAVDGVAVDTFRDAGFKDADIAEAREVARKNPPWTPNSNRTPTWEEYKSYFGNAKDEKGTYPSWWNPVQAVKDIASNNKKAKSVDQLYDDYIKSYGTGNFIKSAYQQFVEDNVPAARALRDNVTLSQISGKEWGASALNLWLLAGTPGVGTVLKGAVGAVELLPAGKETVQVFKEVATDAVEMAKQASSSAKAAIKGTTVAAKDIASGVVTGLKGSVTYSKPVYLEVPAAVGKDAELKFVHSITAEKPIRLSDSFKAGVQEAKTDFARIMKAAELPSVLADRAYAANLKVQILSNLDAAATQFKRVDGVVSPYSKLGIDLKGITPEGTRSALQTAIAESRYYDERFAEMLSNLKSVSKSQLKTLERWSGFKGLTRSIDDIEKARSEVQQLAKTLDDWPFGSEGYMKALDKYTQATSKLDSAYASYQHVLTPRINVPKQSVVSKGITAKESEIRNLLGEIDKAKTELAAIKQKQAVTDLFSTDSTIKPLNTDYLDAMDRVSKLRGQLKNSYADLAKLNSQATEKGFTTNISKNVEGGWPDAINQANSNIRRAENQLARARTTDDEAWIADSLDELKFRENKLKDLEAARKRGEMPPRPSTDKGSKASRPSQSDRPGSYDHSPGSGGQPFRPKPKEPPPEVKMVTERSVDPETGKVIERQKIISEKQRQFKTETKLEEPKPERKSNTDELPAPPKPRRAPSVKERLSSMRTSRPGSEQARDEGLYGSRLKDREDDDNPVDAIGIPLKSVVGVAIIQKSGSKTSANTNTISQQKSSTNTSNETLTKAETGSKTGSETITKTGQNTPPHTKTPYPNKPHPPKYPIKFPPGENKEQRKLLHYQSGDVVWDQGLFWLTVRNGQRFYTKYRPIGYNGPMSGTPDETVQVRGEPGRSVIPMGIVSVTVDPTKESVLDFNAKPPKHVSQQIPRNVKKAIGMR